MSEERLPPKVKLIVGILFHNIVLGDRGQDFEGLTRNQNLLANLRSACQFWNKREEEAQRLFLGLHMFLPSIPWGRNWDYFHSTSSSFWDTGNFSKLSYWAWRVTIGKSSGKLHMHSLCTSKSQNSAYFHSTCSGLWDLGHFAKLPPLGMKLGQWHIYSFRTAWSQNWAYVCSTCNGFGDAGQFWKLSRLSMKRGNLQKFQKLNIHLLSTSRGVEIALMFAVRALVIKIENLTLIRRLARLINWYMDLYQN